MKNKKILMIIVGFYLLIVLIFLPFWINVFFSQVSNYYSHKNNFPKSVETIKYQIKLDQKLFGDKSKATVEAQEKLANRYLLYGDVKKALYYYLDSDKIRKEKKYTNGFWYSYATSSIATCYVDLYDFKKAEFYYKKALEIDKKQNHKEQVIADIINLVNYYIQTNQINKATVQINQLSIILKEKNVEKQYFYPFMIYAQVKYYEKIGNIQRAKILVENILSNKNFSSKQNKTMFLGELAKIYQLQKNFNESEKILNEVVIINGKSSNYEKAKILRKVALLNVATKHDKQAEDYLKKALLLYLKPAFRYSHEVMCNYNYLLMLNPKNIEYIKYFKDFKDYNYYINGLNFVPKKDIKIYLNSACDY